MPSRRSLAGPTLISRTANPRCTGSAPRGRRPTIPLECTENQSSPSTGLRVIAQGAGKAAWAVRMEGMANSFGVPPAKSWCPTNARPLAANHTPPEESESSPTGCACFGRGNSLDCAVRGSKRISLSAYVDAIQIAPSDAAAIPVGKASTGCSNSRTDSRRSAGAAPITSVAAMSAATVETALGRVIVAPSSAYHESAGEQQHAGRGQPQPEKESGRREAPADDVAPWRHRHALEELVDGIDRRGRAVDVRPPSARARLAQNDEGAVGRVHLHCDVARSPVRCQRYLLLRAGRGIRRAAVAEGPESRQREDQGRDAGRVRGLGDAADPVDGIDVRTRALDAVEPEAVLLAGQAQARVQRLPYPVKEDPADSQLGVHVHHVVPVGERRCRALHEHEAGHPVGRAGEVEVGHLAEEVRAGNAHEQIVLGAQKGRPVVVRLSIGSRDKGPGARSEEHTSELQSLRHLVCRLLLEKKKKHKV